MPRPAWGCTPSFPSASAGIRWGKEKRGCELRDWELAPCAWNIEVCCVRYRRALAANLPAHVCEVMASERAIFWSSAEWRRKSRRPFGKQPPSWLVSDRALRKQLGWLRRPRKRGKPPSKSPRKPVPHSSSSHIARAQPWNCISPFMFDPASRLVRGESTFGVTHSGPCRDTQSRNRPISLLVAPWGG